jgi:nucleoside-diphosphate-sugar epimerase
MRVFVTGASGFIGSAVVTELLSHGHQVTGLARSDRSAQAIAAAGAQVRRGSLDDLDSLRAGATAADGVIHTAYIHDFSPGADFSVPASADRGAIEAIGETLAGSGRPLVVAAGTALLAPGRVATEDDDAPAQGAHPRVSEQAALPFAERGVRVSAMRLPPSVHGEGDHGFVPRFIGFARDKGLSAYIGDGANRWASVHRLDAARLFRLALEEAPAGSRLHAIGDEGVPFREIAEVIGRHLDLPVISLSQLEAESHFGGLALFASLDIPASGALTERRYGWQPEQPGLIADLDAGHYFSG